MHIEGQLLLAGCGDIGLRIARLWPRGGGITGLSRSQSALDQLPPGTQHWHADLDRAEPLAFPSSIDLARSHIVYLAPPATEAAQDRRLEKFMSALPQAPASFSYCSTSGVYGDRRGARVDETEAPAPVTERAKRRVWAEQYLAEWRQKTRTRVMILRVPGIYGPGRLPLDKLRAGMPLIRPQEAPWTNLIQADDLARVFIACVLRGKAGVYNVAGGEPVTVTDYYLTVARAAGLAVPEFISLDEAQRTYSPERLSFINESRRLDTSKMHRELQPELRYADLESGVRASLDPANLLQQQSAP